jgi:hypothetical protein
MFHFQWIQRPRRRLDFQWIQCHHHLHRELYLKLDLGPLGLRGNTLFLPPRPHHLPPRYAYQSSQIGVTESSGDIEGFYWARLASFIIRIHSAQLGFGFVAFRRFP